MDREELATTYFDLLPFTPYPVQEEALLAWFTCEEGVLVCAPTGTGKTLIAEAALYEALATGQRAYYTTPLIALTEQKLTELQGAAERWGFSANDIGLVTGNRRVNADAPVLVVVAEILFNRLLHREEFGFENVASVVMDEFHNFNDPERGIVWEFSLGLLPTNVRLLLLSATVGNSQEFVNWMWHRHRRKLDRVEGTERKVPLTFEWVGDSLLTEQIEEMARDREAENRRTPCLVFCFNRDACWNIAEQLKGKKVVTSEQQKALAVRLADTDWSTGAGPQLKQILQRGVGVHHAGILPHYKRVVESLFQEKLLSVVVCTETLAAGVNLPARSVVLPELLKGPPSKKKLIEASAAHQMFGRAGRPQFDTQGFVYALAHEDDVKILRWKEKYDQIPEDTKDPQLRKAKKQLKKKMPTRRSTQQYWNEGQFEKLIAAPASKLQSRGAIPWRYLVHMLLVSSEIDPIRRLLSKRLMPGKQIEQAHRELDRMLMTLWSAGYVRLEPEPREEVSTESGGDGTAVSEPVANESGSRHLDAPPDRLFQLPSDVARDEDKGTTEIRPIERNRKREADGANYVEESDAANRYRIERAIATDTLSRLQVFRSVNPLYGVYVANQLAIADQTERIQVWESMLEMPGTVARLVRVPRHDELPPGPLAVTRLDEQLLRRGLATPQELGAQSGEEEEEDGAGHWDEPVWVLTIAEKLRRLFDSDFPRITNLRTVSVWVAGELLEFGGDFHQYIRAKRLPKQEGVVFRHLLRLILLIGEFMQITPTELSGTDDWSRDLTAIRDRLVDCCYRVDPRSTDQAIEE